MIRSEQDYRFYLEADRVALEISWKKPRLFDDEIWKFERALRKAEFMENCRKKIVDKIAYTMAKYSLKKESIRLGYTIPRNVFGAGLSIAHAGPIIIHPKVKIGENCRIHQCVTIGSIPQTVEVPVIGNNVFIGPGAVIIGAIVIADGIAIGANSYVNKSFTDPNITIAGCPARKISDKGSKPYWPRATEIIRNSANR